MFVVPSGVRRPTRATTGAAPLGRARACVAVRTAAQRDSWRSRASGRGRPMRIADADAGRGAAAAASARGCARSLGARAASSPPSASRPATTAAVATAAESASR